MSETKDLLKIAITISTPSAMSNPPWGPLALGAVNELMDIFGGSAPSTASLIQQAVTELENYWNQHDIQMSENSINEFLNWFQENCSSTALIGSPSDADYIQTSLLRPLMNQIDPSFVNSTVSQLLPLSNNSLLNLDKCVMPDDDEIMPILVLCVSAIANIYQMISVLNAQLAYFNQPETYIAPNSLKKDTDFQYYSSIWLNNINTYFEFIQGNGKNYTGTSQNLYEIAQSVGWIGAIEYLLEARTKCRLASIYTEQLGGMRIFVDRITNYRSRLFSMDPRDNAFDEAYAAYCATLREDLANAYSSVTRTIGDWNKTVENWKKKLPPTQPPQTIEVSFWGPNGGPQNDWENVTAVRYGVSFVSVNRPSLRSDWLTAWVDTNGNQSPYLKHIPTTTGNRIIWRQFQTDPAKNPDPLGVPMIICHDDGTSTTYQDSAILEPNHKLTVNQSITSSNQLYQLIMQGDGNLVLYKGKEVHWCSQTPGSGGDRAIFQYDGNFVVYDSKGKVCWAANCNGRGGRKLEVSDDGRVVITNDDGEVWSS